MKVKCEVCGNLGQVQHLSENYYRVKHYLGSVNGKLRFEYHRQSLEYMRNVLDTSDEGNHIDPIDQETIDLKLNSDGLESKNRRAGSLARLDSSSMAISPAQPPLFLLPQMLELNRYTHGLAV